MAWGAGAAAGCKLAEAHTNASVDDARHAAGGTLAASPDALPPEGARPRRQPARQSSTPSPSTRLNSRMLPVTTTRDWPHPVPHALTLPTGSVCRRGAAAETVHRIRRPGHSPAAGVGPVMAAPTPRRRERRQSHLGSDTATRQRRSSEKGTPAARRVRKARNPAWVVRLPNSPMEEACILPVGSSLSSRERS